MSLDIKVRAIKEVEIYEANITYNLENIEPTDDDYNFEVQNDIHSKIEILQDLLED